MTAKDAGRRVDELRRALEVLDPLIDGLITQEVEALDRYDDPLGFRDGMSARFPALSNLDWPW